MSKQRCKGWMRTGGAFTFGPVRWDQCEKDGVVILTVRQEGSKEKPMPACLSCWEECTKSKNISVLSATPIKEAHDESV